MICPCGRPIETTAADPFTIVQYDKESNIVYAVCQHGVVVVDNRPKPVVPVNDNFLFNQEVIHANSL